MITTGLLTVFIWDTLVFDKRDAMVLGPLPLRGPTIVGAKLAALATFLVGAALAVNVDIGPAVRVGDRRSRRPHPSPPRRPLRGHDRRRVLHLFLVVIVRGLLVLLSGAHSDSVGAVLQFVFLSAVLCFMMVPTATGQVTRRSRGSARCSNGSADRVSKTCRPGAICVGRLPAVVSARSASRSAVTGARCAQRSHRPPVSRAAPACGDGSRLS